MIFNKTRKYFQEKVRIDKKANQSTAYKVQVYNNAKVDELVKKYNEGETVNIKTPPSALWAELAIINKPEVYKNYNKIINSKYTSNDNMDKLIIKNKANKDLNRIVEAEVERISKNLDYVNQVMQKYEIPQKQYEEFKRKQQNNSIASRQEILKQVAIKNNEILASEGLNIPSNVFSYRNLDLTAETLLRQSQMQSKHEEVNSINQHYINQGKDKVYTGKEWIWTGRGKTTRHRSNHLQKRAVNEPFIIVNDKTLHIDEMMYPSDPAGSFSNAFICYCEVEYLTDYNEYKENLFGLHPTTYKPTTTYNAPTFAPTLKQKPISVVQPAGLNITDNMKINVGEPIVEPIDVNAYGILPIPHNYLIDGKKVDIIFNNGKYYYHGLELIDYNPTTQVGKVSKKAVTKHNNLIDANKITNQANNPNTVEIEVLTKKPETEFIDTTMFDYIDDMEAYKINDYDNIKIYNGEYYYNGLKMDYYDEIAKYGYIDIKKVNAHNNEVLHGSIIETVAPKTVSEPKIINDDYLKVDRKPVKEIINTALLEYEEGIGYIIYDFDGIKKYDGKYYYKGLELDYYDPKIKEGFISKETILEHNKSLTGNNVIERGRHLTEEEAEQMGMYGIAEHYGATYMTTTDFVDGKEYIVFTQKLDNEYTGYTEFNIYFEVEAYHNYDRISAEVVLNEVFKVPENVRRETRKIWFKDSEDTCVTERGVYPKMKRSVKGSNYYCRITPNNLLSEPDANHRIIINSNFFKKRKDLFDETWYMIQDKVNLNDYWKKTLHHEFMHSGDLSRGRWLEYEGLRHSEDREYQAIHDAEPSFTPYANTKIGEDFADHGGYISAMEANPDLQGRKIQVKVYDEEYGGWIMTKINYEEYKKKYPKHYAYFMNRLYGEGF